MNMWYFIVKDLESVAEYTFDTYDTDGSGELTKPEIFKMIEEVYGSEAINTTVRLFIEDMDGRDQNKKISKREFTAHCTDYPQVIYPAMVVQTHLRANIGGEKFWKRLINESKRCSCVVVFIMIFRGTQCVRALSPVNFIIPFLN